MVRVRDAVPADAGRLLEIYSYYVEHTAVSFEYETPPVSEFQERMWRILRRFPYLAAEEDGRILGYAYAGSFHDRAAYGWSAETTIYIARDARGRGIGRMLYRALEERLREMGILNLYACIGYTETEDEYLTKGSPRFHARMGYREIGHFHKCGYKFGRWYDMIWMEKLIGVHENGAAPLRTQRKRPLQQ